MRKGRFTSLGLAALVALVAAVMPVGATQRDPEGPGAPPPDPLGTLLPATGEAPIGEPLLDEWTARTRTYDTGVDGTFVTELYASRVNHLDDGSWAPIDTTLVEGSELGLESADNSIAIAIAEEGDTGAMGRVGLPDGAVVTFGLEGAGAVAAVVDESAATFNDIAPSIDVELEALPSGIKETIVLHDAETPDSFRFPLELDGLTAAVVDRAVVLSDVDGQPRLVIPPGVMEDSSEGLPAESDAVNYELVDEGTTLEVRLDRAWLDDPARVYPVRVDPSVLLYAAGDDTYVNELTPANNAQALTLNVGRGASGYRNRGFLRFNTSSLNGMNLHGATLNLWQATSASCTPTPVDVYAVSEPVPWTNDTSWPGPDTDLSTRYATVSSGAGFSAACPAGIVSTDLTRLVAEWTSGGFSNRGIALRARDEPTFMQFKKFASAQTYTIPSLDVVWTDPTLSGAPSVPTAPAPSGTLTVNPPVLSAFYDDPQSDNGKLVFRTYDAGTGALLNTYVSPEVTDGATASVTAASVPLDTPLEWTVTARDVAGTKYSPSSGPVPIVRPSIRVSAPAPDADVTPTTSVTVSVGAGASVSSVDFLVDGTVVATDSSAPFVSSSALSAVGPGAHRLGARVTGSGITAPDVPIEMDPAVGPAPLTMPDLSELEISTTLVAQMIADFGMSATEAADIITATASAYQVNEQLEELFPHEYAGSWVDHDDDGGTVTTALSTQAAATSAEDGMPAGAEPLDFVVVDASLADLLGAQDTVDLGLQEALAPSALNDTSVSVNIRENRVDVRVEATSPEASPTNSAMPALETEVDITYDGDVVVDVREVTDQDLTESPRCHPTFCLRPFRGGLLVRPVNPAPGVGPCTSGVHARRGDRYFVVTAGHCFASNALIEHACCSPYDLGKVTFRWNPNQHWRGDFEVIEFEDPGYWKPTDTIVTPDRPNFHLADRLRRPAASVIGDYVCHVGQGMDHNTDDYGFDDFEACARVSDNYGSGRRGITDPMWVCDGDSGGPVYNPSTNQLYGILSSTLGADEGENCDDEYRMTFTWATQVIDFWNRSGATIVTHDQNWPA